jgi:hypothetical protein
VSGKLVEGLSSGDQPALQYSGDLLRAGRDGGEVLGGINGKSFWVGVGSWCAVPIVVR